VAPTRRFDNWPRLETVIGAFFGVWGLSIGLGRLADNSLFTHVATGRLLADGTFPRTDPYSFTATGESWVVQSWLASLLYGMADAAWGGDGVRLVMAVVTTILALLVWQLSRSAGALAGRIALTAVVLGVGTTLWAPRPLLIGLVGLALVLLAAEGRLWPPAMVAVLWIWANSHGSFPLGLVAIGALVVGRRLDGDDPRVEQRVLLWAGLGTLLAVVGPLGPRVLTFPFQLLSRQEVLGEVVEWQSPSFDSVWARLFLVQLIGATVLLVRRPSYRVAVPLVVFAAAALLGTRNIAVASIVLVPGMAYGLAGLGALRGDRRTPAAWLGLAAALLCGVVVLAGALREPAYDLRGYPVDAVAWVQSRDLLVPELRVATNERSGNYLELVRGPEANVFVDDRFDMYPPEIIEDLLVLLRGRPGWDEVLGRHDVDVVLWPRREPLTGLLGESTGWQVGYADADWVVACRRPLRCA
jgi:hypothetical protein